ncbi:MAG: imidazole glycerol phosphate synthase subunit hisH [Candidatus Desulfovibrio kirbyi]|uniref:Imidazole glycerol phosphate synthase subunit HisH n=1 Tax=Candidatus Desulfovibrio kirbyi TaxID=2696086 RepID=A0A6L2R3Y1_9BACT|nr:MAG: imidazole glycerol phosphate synthase subunit hisH [Candidatus Desulfovibrio kirbyi]
MLAILEYGAGNQTSVRRALKHLRIPCVITADPATLARVEGIIFPGVGAAGQAMRALVANGAAGALRLAVERGVPLLGICLGCQILLTRSEENDTRTLDIVPGVCRRFEKDLAQEDGSLVQVPHMGWNSLRARAKSPLLEGIAHDAEFYFVHSYYVNPMSSFVIATTFYGFEFCSMYGRDGLWAVQFHPEKSGAPGLTLLRNFYSYCRESRCAQ